MSRANRGGVLSGDDARDYQKLDQIRAGLSAVGKQVKDAQARLQKLQGDALDSKVDIAAFRVERSAARLSAFGREVVGSGNAIGGSDVAKLKYEISTNSDAVGDLSELLLQRSHNNREQQEHIKRLLALHEQQVALSSEELHLWIVSHRKNTVELDETQRVHTKVAMYAARAIHERKEWQVVHGTQASVDSTQGFVGRCKALMEDAMASRIRFGDDAPVVADKHTFVLQQQTSSLYPQAGAKAELDMLHSLMEMLTTGIRSDGSVMNVDIIIARHQQELQTMQRKFANVLLAMLRQLLGLRTYCAGIRDVVSAAIAETTEVSRRVHTEVMRYIIEFCTAQDLVHKRALEEHAAKHTPAPPNANTQLSGSGLGGSRRSFKRPSTATDPAPLAKTKVSSSRIPVKAAETAQAAPVTVDTADEAAQPEKSAAVVVPQEASAPVVNARVELPLLHRAESELNIVDGFSPITTIPGDTQRTFTELRCSQILTSANAAHQSDKIKQLTAYQEQLLASFNGT